MAISTK